MSDPDDKIPDDDSTIRSASWPPRPPERSIRKFRLHVTERGGATRLAEFGQVVVRCGVREGNDLIINDPEVSRIHFEITSAAHGFRLTDLESTNGTVVDGYLTGDIYLKAGSRIEVGQTLIVFEPLDEVSTVPAADEAKFGPMVGRTPAMRELFAILQRAAPSQFTLLVEGESGVGKELVAEAVHDASPRAKGPFVVVDCAAVPPSLLESEFFGHEKGAFTGAQDRRIGSLEQANGGTLFLDEIGELPLTLQPKLLRALEKREIRRLGGSRTTKLDVRIVAATNRDLAREVNRGTFRDDLYYRLAVLRVVVPPLRDRREDIRLLAEHFVRSTFDDDVASADRFIQSTSDADWAALAAQNWPGNVRELRNTIERSIVLGGIGRGLTASAAPSRTSAAVTSTEALECGIHVDLSQPFQEARAAVLAEFEKAYTEKMLELHDGKVLRAAAASGIDRAYFRRILRRHS